MLRLPLRIGHAVDRLAALRLACRFFFLAAFSYNYASARVITLALADVAAGPDFWLDNLDMAERRAQIRGFSASEALVPIDRAQYNAVPTRVEESPARRLLRLFTLNGFLLPAFLLKNAVAFQHKSFFGTLRGVFRHKKILYEYEPLGIAYVAVHDKRRFFGELAGFLPCLARFIVMFGKLTARYQEAMPAMTSEAFWQHLYQEETRAEKEEVLF